MIIKNNKGDGAIVLLVLLVLLVTATALFVFLTNTWKFESKISDARVIEELYLKEELVKFYVEQAGDKATKTSGDFEENFKTEFEKYSFDEDYLKDVKKIVREGEFNVLDDDEVLEIVINSWKMKESFGNIQVSYSPNISVGFSVE